MFQAHSETSREAYRTLEGAKEAAERIFREIEAHGLAGISGPQIAEALEMIPGTVAARIIQLERAGRVIRLERTQKSPRGKKANIVISAALKSHALAAGDRILVTKPEGETAESINSEMVSILREVENLVALGSPILYGSELHKRIQRAAR